MRVRGPNGAALLEIPLRSKTFSFLPAYFTPLPFWLVVPLLFIISMITAVTPVVHNITDTIQRISFIVAKGHFRDIVMSYFYSITINVIVNLTESIVLISLVIMCFKLLTLSEVIFTTIS
jgi:hypothetical protein